MTTLPALAVTGSTGALGGLVAHDLADRGVPQRLIARSPERAPRPLVVVISGPSGVGKDETIRHMKAHGLPFHCNGDGVEIGAQLGPGVYHGGPLLRLRRAAQVRPDSDENGVKARLLREPSRGG